MKRTVKRYVHDENDPNSLSCDNIYDMVEDGQQRLWIATYKGGLNMYDLRQKHDGVFLHKNNGLSGWPTDVESDKVRCLHITPQQVLIAGTLNGLYTCSLGGDLRDMKFWHHCRRPDDATSLSNNWVMDIEPLRDHTVAIATSGGGFCQFTASCKQCPSPNSPTRRKCSHSTSPRPSESAACILSPPSSPHLESLLSTTSQLTICQRAARWSGRRFW